MLLAGSTSEKVELSKTLGAQEVVFHFRKWEPNIYTAERWFPLALIVTMSWFFPIRVRKHITFFSFLLNIARVHSSETLDRDTVFKEHWDF